MVSLVLMVIFGMAWWRTISQKLDRAIADIAEIKKELTTCVKFSDHAATSNQQWEVIRKMEREQYAQQQVELDRKKRRGTTDDEDDT